MRTKYNQSGQILLITLLILSFAAIVVLSLISRTTQTQTISTQIEDSAKALAAAEAGLELALQNQHGQSGSVEAGVEFTVAPPIEIGVADTIYQLPDGTPKGDLAVVWLANHVDGDLDETATNDYDGSYVNVCWKASDNAAVVATLLYKEGTDGSYRVTKAAFDRTSGSRPGGNNEFSWNSTAVQTCGVTGYEGQRIRFSDLITTPDVYNRNSDTLIALRLRPLYAGTQFAVQTEGTYKLKPQGKTYTSTGTTDSGTTRVVQVDQIYPAPGAIFDYVIYSQQGDFAQ